MSDAPLALAAVAVALAKERLGDAVLDVVEHRGETTIIVAPARIADLGRILRDAPELRFDFLADITAVDWPEREPRYDVVYQLTSITTRANLRLKARVGAADEDHPALPSVVAVWPAANWCEREIYDLFGIVFTDHPDLRRIMMPDDWTSHPLRKDYPLTGITLPEPRWGGQVPADAPLAPGTGRQTLRGPGAPDAANTTASPLQRVEGQPPTHE